jgi:hypothetical protein
MFVGFGQREILDLSPARVVSGDLRIDLVLSTPIRNASVTEAQAQENKAISVAYVAAFIAASPRIETPPMHDRT